MEYLYLTIIVSFVAVAIAIAYQAAQQRQRQAAKGAYQRSLSRLRNDPNNASLRRGALELGRVYSNLTRNHKGVTLFDEVAVKNDIDAACAGAVTMAQSARQLDGQSVQERLARLDDLSKSGMLTDAEYNEQRKRILDSI